MVQWAAQLFDKHTSGLLTDKVEATFTELGSAIESTVWVAKSEIVPLTNYLQCIAACSLYLGAILELFDRQSMLRSLILLLMHLRGNL